MSTPQMLVQLSSDDLRGIILGAVAEPLGGSLPGSEPPREVLTRKEAADFLRVSLATLDRLARDGDITPRRVGDSPRYLRSELLVCVRGATESESTAPLRALGAA